jgi:hypothetical protein
MWSSASSGFSVRSAMYSAGHTMSRLHSASVGSANDDLGDLVAECVLEVGVGRRGHADTHDEQRHRDREGRVAEVDDPVELDRRGLALVAPRRPARP